MFTKPENTEYWVVFYPLNFSIQRRYPSPDGQYLMKFMNCNPQTGISSSARNLERWEPKTLMQCFLIWAGNRRNTAPKQQQKPADQKTAGMQKKLCLTFSFSYLHNREEKPEQKTTHQIPANRISSLLFSLSRVFCDTLFWKKNVWWIGTPCPYSWNTNPHSTLMTLIFQHRARVSDKNHPP